MLDLQTLRPEERAGLRLRALYRRRGYLPYRMSRFEPYDLYARNKSFLVSEHILTFTDTDGRLMALKPDVTLSIVRSAPGGGTTQKVYYQENVYRTSPAAAGYREIPQAGLECIGSLDLLDVAEVLELAAESLALLSGSYLLELGHAGVVSALLEGLPENARPGALEELGRKNTAALRALCAQAGADPAQAERLCRLAQLHGTPGEILPQLSRLAGSAAGEAQAELGRLCALLERRAPAERLRLDFSIVNDMRYYNGVIFRGCLPGLASGVLAGGRYDNLLRRMGKTGGAAGFAVYLDQLERLEEEDGYDVDVLLLYSPGDDPAAVSRLAGELREEGRSVRLGRSAPPGLRCRETLRFGEGGGRSWTC